MSKFISPSASNLATLTLKDRKRAPQEQQQRSSQPSTDHSSQFNVGRFKKLRQFALGIARGEKSKNQNRSKSGNLTYWESVSLENVKIKENLIKSGIIDPDSEESDTSMVMKDPRQDLEIPSEVPRSAPPLVSSFIMKSRSGTGSTSSTQYNDSTLVLPDIVKPNVLQSTCTLSTSLMTKERPADGHAASAQYNDGTLRLPPAVMPVFPHSAPPAVVSFSLKPRPAGGSSGSTKYCDNTLAPSQAVQQNFLLSRTPKHRLDQGRKGSKVSNHQDGFQKPLISITNAFRDSYHSTTTVSTELEENVDSGRTPSTPPRSSQPQLTEKMEKHLLLSPKFLFPRPAPKPPHANRVDFHPRFVHPVPYSAPPKATTFNVKCSDVSSKHERRNSFTIRRGPDNASHSLCQDREEFLDCDIEIPTPDRPILSVKITSPVPDDFSTPASSDSLHQVGDLQSPASVSSGLARIGTALLCAGQSTEDVSTFDTIKTSSTSDSGIRASASEGSNTSVTSVLAALENLGLKALEIFARQELGSDTPKLSSTISAPADLSNHNFRIKVIDSGDCKSCENEGFIEPDSCKTTTGSWNSWNASLSETFSNLEQLLQAQGVDVPRPEKIAELWQALAFSPSAKSSGSRRSFRSLKSYNSHMNYKGYKDQKSGNLCVKHSGTKDKSARLSTVSCACSEVIPETTSLSNVDFVGMAI